MNERIRELAKQAEIPNNILITTYSGKTIKKFAELIIGECARVARNNTPDTEECEYTHLVSKAIKEHFGVEE